jgi:hypothetical protein
VRLHEGEHGSVHRWQLRKGVLRGGRNGDVQ